MSKTKAVPQQGLATRSKNKTVHPGTVDKAQQRRTKEEVKEEKEAKARAKKALAEARQQSINRAAEFEHAAIANEDMVDATPRPTFIPKPRPLLKRKNSPLTSLADTSDVEADNVDGSPFIPNSQGLADEEESAADVESDGPRAHPTKKKAKTTLKATAGKKQETPDVETDVASDEEAPKPKKVKAKMRDEIDVATTKIVKNERGLGNKYAQMVNSMPAEPASKAVKVPLHSSQLQAVPRPLKREGAIANLADSSTRADPNNVR